MSETQKSPDMGTVTFWGNNGAVELMRLSPAGVWVNPELPTTECAQQVLEALRPLIQHTIDEAVERLKAENARLTRERDHAAKAERACCIRAIQHMLVTPGLLPTYTFQGFTCAVPSSDAADAMRAITEGRDE